MLYGDSDRDESDNDSSGGIGGEEV